MPGERRRRGAAEPTAGNSARGRPPALSGRLRPPCSRAVGAPRGPGCCGSRAVAARAPPGTAKPAGSPLVSGKAGDARRDWRRRGGGPGRGGGSQRCARAAWGSPGAPEARGATPLGAELRRRASQVVWWVLLSLRRRECWPRFMLRAGGLGWKAGPEFTRGSRIGHKEVNNITFDSRAF